MTTIVTRAGKGSPLTHTEVDTNFTNLNTAKLETAAIPLGTLQAPSVSFLNDSDTGIFCPQGGNSLAIATGGQYAITCTSTQAVGIKTANPQKALHVAGPTRVGADDATDAFLEIGEGASGNRNSYIDIVADTTYTDYGLRIIRNNTGANATSELKHRGTGALNFTTQEAAPIVFNTTNSPRLTILAGGNVGIGDSGPESLLHLKGSNATLKIESSVNTGYSAVEFDRAADDTHFAIYAYDSSHASQANNVQFYGYQNGNIQFITNSNATPRLTITSGGLVGIGTTSPSKKLEVAGDIVMTGLDGFGINYAANAGSCFLSRGGVLTSNVQFGGATSNLDIGSGGGFQINLGKSQCTFNSFPDTANAGQAITLQERMRIDTSGRLLVGTTSADGLISNISPVVAGAFKSHSGSVSIAPSTTVTIFTIPASNGEGAYTVTAIYVNGNNVPVFSAYAVILYDGSATNAYRAMGFDGSLLSITVSGRDVQLTTGATYTQGIKWSFVKQAVA